MKTLLIVNSSPRRNAVSRRLTHHYAEQWRAANPEGRILERDLATEPLPLVTQSWIEASYTPEEHRTPEQRQLLQLSDTLIDELFTADEILLGVPMHNFSIPASLKAWIDLIARSGKTFRYSSRGAEGMIPSGKKVIAIFSSGGAYGEGSPADFQVPYLRHVLSFLGLTDLKVVRADRQGLGGEAAEQAVANAMHQLSAATASLAAI